MFGMQHQRGVRYLLLRNSSLGSIESVQEKNGKCNNSHAHITGSSWIKNQKCPNPDAL